MSSSTSLAISFNPNTTSTDILNALAYRWRKGIISIDEYEFMEKYISNLSIGDLKDIVQKISACELVHTKYARDRMFIHILCQLSIEPRFSRRKVRQDHETAICTECQSRSAWAYDVYERWPEPSPYNDRWDQCCAYSKHIPGHEIYAVEISNEPLKLSRKNRAQRNRAEYKTKYPKVYKDINYLAQFRLTLPRALKNELFTDIDIICSI